MNHRELRKLGWKRKNITLSPTAVIIFNEIECIDEYLNDLLIEIAENGAHQNGKLQR
ncbi:MAG: hypothetical protein K8R25_15100 [Methanosarcinales archaeon]|nr:hypothetical protein [Methanosarcinales archaeon]